MLNNTGLRVGIMQGLAANKIQQRIYHCIKQKCHKDASFILEFVGTIDFDKFNEQTLIDQVLNPLRESLMFSSDDIHIIRQQWVDKYEPYFSAFGKQVAEIWEELAQAHQEHLRLTAQIKQQKQKRLKATKLKRKVATLEAKQQNTSLLPSSTTSAPSPTPFLNKQRGPKKRLRIMADEAKERNNK